MISLPLFGQDSPIQRFSKLISIAVTFGLWLGMFIVILFINPKPNPKEETYKTVQIVLADRPERKVELNNTSSESVEMFEEGGQTSEVNEVTAPEPAPAPAPKTEAPAVIEQTPVQPVQPKTETVKTETPKPAPEPVKTQPAPAKPEPVPEQKTAAATPVPVKEVEKVEVAKTVTTKPEKKPFSWDDFDDEPEVKTQAPKKVVSTQSGVEGSTGTTSTSQPATKTSSSSTTDQKTNKTSTSSTANALGNIENAKATAETNGTSQTSAPAKATSVSTGKISLSFTGGGPRFATSTLSIKLSEEAKKYIDQTVKLPITFTIQPDGSVLRSSIQVPGSMVNQVVRAEIINAISKWRFDEAEEQTVAKFNYHIIVQ